MHSYRSTVNSGQKNLSFCLKLSMKILNLSVLCASLKLKMYQWMEMDRQDKSLHFYSNTSPHNQQPLFYHLGSLTPQLSLWIQKCLHIEHLTHTWHNNHSFCPLILKTVQTMLAPSFKPQRRLRSWLTCLCLVYTKFLEQLHICYHTWEE